MSDETTSPGKGVSLQLLTVRIIVIVALAIGMTISWKLWYSGNRIFPLLPLDGFPTLPGWAELIILTGAAGFLIGSLFSQYRQGALTFLGIALLSFLAGCDQTRWQPWFYQYGLLLIPFIFSEKSDVITLKMQRVIMIAVYFWAGYHKLGPLFHEVWIENFVLPLKDHLSENHYERLSGMSKFVPWLEMSIAVFLIFTRTRWIGIIFAILMHLSILFMIGPLMGDRNEVIWPWNLAMIALVIVLFRPKNREGFSAAISSSNWRQLTVFPVILILTFVMPYFSKTGKWDRYLSFHLYSGKGHRYALILLPQGVKKLPEHYHPFLMGEPPQAVQINASGWAFQELKVPTVSEDRIMLKWCQKMMEIKFNDWDCFIHHDIPRDPNVSNHRLKPTQIRQLEKIPTLPVIDPTKKR